MGEACDGQLRKLGAGDSRRIQRPVSENSASSRTSVSASMEATSVRLPPVRTRPRPSLSPNAEGQGGRCPGDSDVSQGAAHPADRAGQVSW